MTTLEVRQKLYIYRMEIHKMHDKISQANQIIHHIEELLFDIEDKVAEGLTPSANNQTRVSDELYGIADEYLKQLKNLI